MSDAIARDFAAVEAGIDDIRSGRMVLVVDDEDTDNEGALVMAAERITPEAVNFMGRYGRGLICVPMLAERLDQLQISMMVSENTVPPGAAFTVSVDARWGVTTGASAACRMGLSRAQRVRSSTPRFARPRAMMSRWISLVPSQMRSTRVSRQRRSTGLSRR